MDLVARAHLSSVSFSPKAYMGCGGWDLARAPSTTARPRRNPFEDLPSRAARRSVMGCGGGGFSADPTPIVDINRREVEEDELSGAGCSNCSTGVKMGCGDEQCKACAEMGCLKCKRARKKAIMQQNQELGAVWIGQAQPMTRALVGLGIVGGLFYLATQL